MYVTMLLRNHNREVVKTAIAQVPALAKVQYAYDGRKIMSAVDAPKELGAVEEKVVVSVGGRRKHYLVKIKSTGKRETKSLHDATLPLADRANLLTCLDIAVKFALQGNRDCTHTTPSWSAFFFKNMPGGVHRLDALSEVGRAQGVKFTTTYHTTAARGRVLRRAPRALGHRRQHGPVCQHLFRV